MSASISDILTATKNIVTALNGEMTNATFLAGARNAVGITSQSVVSTAAGRAVNIVVCVAGSTTGSVWDASSTATATSSRLLYTIPTAVGVYVVNMPVAYGIVVTPGTGMTIAVSYS